MVAHGRPSLASASAHPVLTAVRVRGKRACDLGLGLLLLVLALPVIALLWCLVRLTSRGPGFYSQVRVGLLGRHYRIYKIRSMTHNCEAGSGAKWATKGDCRVTPIGRILRKLHLDELPQLWNVIRGDMSLVGPRPERPEFVEPLSRQIVGYEQRHRVRPGVTGLAQIQLPPDSDVESVRRKLVLDRHYVENASPWLDLRLLVGTFVYLFGFSYARVRRMVALPNPLEGLPRKDDTRERIGPLGQKLRLGASATAPSAAEDRSHVSCGEPQ